MSNKLGYGLFASLGIFGFCLWACVLIGGICLSIYGLILSFSASIVLGIIALIIEPAPLVVGLVKFAFNYNIPEHLVKIFSGN
jgi:hypothetical protein